MFFSPKSTAQETVLGTSIALNSTVNVADGYMTCGFTSFSAVLHIRTTAGVGGGGEWGAVGDKRLCAMEPNFL